MKIFAQSGSAENWNNTKQIKGKVQGITFISEEFTGTMDGQNFWDSLADIARRENKFIQLVY